MDVKTPNEINITSKDVRMIWTAIRHPIDQKCCNPLRHSANIHAHTFSLHRHHEKHHSGEMDEKMSWRGLKKVESALIS